MAQVLEQSNLEESELFDSQSKLKIKLPKKTEFNYFYMNIPMKKEDLPSQTYPYPIVQNSMLYCFAMLTLSKRCKSCKKLLLPKRKMMKVDSICSDCKIQKPIQKEDEIKRSSIIDTLTRLLDSLFTKYHINSELQEKSDYTQRYHHKLNMENYLGITIIKDAVEVKSCIDGLISWNKWHPRYFYIDGKSYKQLLQEVIANDNILKFEPFYKLLIMTSSLLKSPDVIIRPMMRYPRTSPANVTNVENMMPRTNVDQKSIT